jgi:ribosome-binding factor A
LDSGQALERAVSFVQHEIGRKMKLKYIPKIRFVYDHSLEEGARIEKALQKLRLAENFLSEKKESKNDS